MSRTAAAICAASIIGVLAAGAALRSRVPSQCASPGKTDRTRLINSLRTRYRLPSNAEIGVADGGVVLGSCFRKLVFETLRGPRFRVELIASPDFRFLASDLLDARPDPRQAEQQRRQTAQALEHGTPPARGSGGAPVTVAVFSDFQCPYCARLAENLNEVEATDGDKLRVIYHYFPLSMHPWAEPAAQAAACAQRESNAAFWSLHDFLFTHQRELSADNLGSRVAEWARRAPELDRQRFSECVSRSLTSGQVQQDVALGNDLWVHSTPTVFVNGDPVRASSAAELRDLVREAAKAR